MVDSLTTSGREPDAPSDRDLVQAIADGSDDALGALYDRHARLVYTLARRMLPHVEDAEEVVQDVFAQVWRDAGRYDPARGAVGAWLVTLARSRAVDRLRAGRARPDLGTAVEPDAAGPLVAADPSPEQAAVAAQRAGAVRQALQLLPDVQRHLLEMAYFGGFSQSEIAARTGVPLGTVKTRIRSAMTSLTAVLAS